MAWSDDRNEGWMCRFVPRWPSSSEYLAELSGVVSLTAPKSQVGAPLFRAAKGGSQAVPTAELLHPAPAGTPRTSAVASAMSVDVGFSSDAEAYRGVEYFRGKEDLLALLSHARHYRRLRFAVVVGTLRDHSGRCHQLVGRLSQRVVRLITSYQPSPGT